MRLEGSHGKHDLKSGHDGSCRYQFYKTRARQHLLGTSGLLGRGGQRCPLHDSSFQLGNRHIVKNVWSPLQQYNDQHHIGKDTQLLRRRSDLLGIV